MTPINCVQIRKGMWQRFAFSSIIAPLSAATRRKSKPAADWGSDGVWNK